MEHFHVHIQTQSWAVTADGGTLEEAVEAAVAVAMRVMAAEAEGTQPSTYDSEGMTGVSDSPLWEFMKLLPPDCKDSDNLFPVMEMFGVKTDDDVMKLGVHKVNALVEEIRRRNRKTS